MRLRALFFPKSGYGTFVPFLSTKVEFTGRGRERTLHVSRLRGRAVRASHNSREFWDASYLGTSLSVMPAVGLSGPTRVETLRLTDCQTFSLNPRAATGGLQAILRGRAGRPHIPAFDVLLPLWFPPVRF